MTGKVIRPPENLSIEDPLGQPGGQLMCRPPVT